MSCEIIEHIWSRKVGAFGKSLVFALVTDGALVPLASLTSVSVKFRKRTEPRSSGVAGQGTLEAYADPAGLYNVRYLWSDDDPDEPGTYLVEVDALNGDGDPVSFPDSGEHMLIRIVEDVA